MKIRETVWKLKYSLKQKLKKQYELKTSGGVLDDNLGAAGTGVNLQDPWFSAVCDSYLNPPVSYNGNELPKFPPDSIQINTTGQAGLNTLAEAFVFYEDCVSTFKNLGASIEPHHKLLDFGCGWGRVSRFFLNQIALQNIHGIDVMEEFAVICRDTFGSPNFSTCPPLPPASIPDNSMDFVVGYSVFSHLSEEACAKWMQEFHRILQPGGIVALTTRGRPFFDYCESLQGTEQTGYSDALSRMFDDFDNARACYDKGLFVHSNHEGVNGGGEMNADFYGETFIPEAYAKTAYSEFFTLEKFLFSPPRQSHPIMFFRRK